MYDEPNRTTVLMTSTLRACLLLACGLLPGPGSILRPSISSAWGCDRCLGAAAWFRIATKHALHAVTEAMLMISDQYSRVEHLYC
jgi:hypothetical protein